MLPIWCSAAGALVLAMVALLACLGTASAHAALVSTDPVDGAVLPDRPAALTLTFNEPVQVIDEGLRLFNSSGSFIVIEGRNVGNAISVPVPGETSEGSYILSWRVISADGHPIAGTLGFAIGAPSATPVVIDLPDASATLDRLLSLIQGIGYLTLLAVVGLVIFRHLILPESALSTHRWSELSVTLAAIAMVCRLIELPVTVLRQEGLLLSRMTDVRHWLANLDSDLWLASVVVLVCIALADLVSSAEESPLFVKIAAVLVALGTATALTLVGHTRVFQPTWLIVTSNMIHVMAAAFWIGGLLGLGLYLRGSDPDDGVGERRRMPRDAVDVIMRFSSLAAGFVSLLVLSGAISAWRILPNLESLWSERYGQLLLLKIGITAVVLIIAAWNRYRLVPAVNRETNNPAAWARIDKTVRAEFVLLLAIVLVTGFLINQSPQTAASSTPTTASAVETVTWSLALGGDTLEGSMNPGSVGENVVQFTIVDANGETVVPIEPPVVRFSLSELDLGPFEAMLDESDADGTWQFTADVPLAGEWTFEFIVRTSRFDEPIAKITFTID
jgi:copper transport protein